MWLGVQQGREVGCRILLHRGEGMSIDIRVIEICLWPNRSCTTLIGTPACSNSVAQVCRRP